MKKLKIIKGIYIFIAIVIISIIQTTAKSNGIILGAIPTFIIAYICYKITEYLYNKYSESHKFDDDKLNNNKKNYIEAPNDDFNHKD